ncbi:MAG: magnesium-translocating P-type ATPase [Rickettsiales bacterium]|nr:MAG: magnesium-translocating P-type ATPase [Rickettsiales bacterium]
MVSNKTNKETKAQDALIKENLFKSADFSAAKIVEEYDTNLKKGYTSDFVEELQEKDGYNEIVQEEDHSVFSALFESFVNPFSVVLIILAVVSFITGDSTAGWTIITLVLLSGFIRFIQEEKSNSASEKLKTMINTTATVLRDGKRKEVSIDEIVAGDIIYLSSGDIIPADLRIIEAKDLFISQSSLTGESEPIEKVAEITKANLEKITSPLDLTNIAFMGTNVISGVGIGIVVAIGLKTYFGSMSKSIMRKKTPTAFDKGINSISWFLIKFMVIMVIIVFLVNGYMKNDWLEAFLFAISIAVGLTPEMLPVIVSANLAKGAITMSQKKTIVKNINSIQNFGAMDILCSDKTGTLTENMVVLQYYYNLHKVEDDRVLRHAYLNSQFQTGLKNLLDLAIIDKAEENETLFSNKFKYEKIDELPFDFIRRRMSVLLQDRTEKLQLITKGALEEMLKVCKWVEWEGQILELNEELQKQIEKNAMDLNEDGMRVLALAQKNDIEKNSLLTKDVEKDMVLMGFLTFLDPPKNSSKTAIQALKEHNVRVKVLTGDNEPIAKYVCNAVGITNSKDVVNGQMIDTMSDDDLIQSTRSVDIFAKLNPSQKIRVIKALKADGHVVGYMGDGINDAGAMKESDVAISVDTAVDIAKESADIILLKKDLNVLVQGVIEGRKIFCNIIKYLKMTISSNFGNMFSVLFASIWLPFLPMLPVQILLLNLFYDLSQTTIPWDNIDAEYIQTQKKWNAASIKKFMLWVGPTSSICDLLLFYVMFKILGWDATLFQTGWFVASMITQTAVIYLIRTQKVPFLQSTPSIPVIHSTTTAMVVAMVLPYFAVSHNLGLMPLPAIYFAYVVGIVVIYMILVQLVKKMYVKKYKEWL